MAQERLGDYLARAGEEFSAGITAWRLWSKLGWFDLLARYRRSWIGPLWLVLSAAIFMAALSVVYATLFHIALTDYLPFVAVGVSVWGFVAAIIGESSLTFIESEGYIRQTNITPFVYVFRVLWRNIVVFCHQFIVTITVLVLSGSLYISSLPIAALGLILLFAQALWVLPLLGMIGTRYRDSQSIVQNGLQVLFFVTPVFWPAASLGSRRWLADFNPLNSIIDVVREPLLGRVPSLMSYGVVIALTLLGSFTAAAFFGRFKNRLIYWL